MKRVNFSNGMRMAPLLGLPLGLSIARRLDISLDNLRPRRNARYPQHPQTHLRTSVPRSPQVCRVNLHVCPLLSLLFVQYILHACCAVTPQQPLPPPRKLWYDKLADALLGEDEPPVNAAASHYALICQKCSSHNGLVKEDMWDDARTHDPLLHILNDVDDDRFTGRIRLSQVWAFQPLCTLPAERFPISAATSYGADSCTSSTARCIAPERAATPKPC